MGLTFKEDCPDMRNSKVFNIIKELKEYPLDLNIVDPYIDGNDERLNSLNIKQFNKIPYDNSFKIVIGFFSRKIFLISRSKNWLYDSI